MTQKRRHKDDDIDSNKVAYFYCYRYQGMVKRILIFLVTRVKLDSGYFTMY